MLQMLHITMCCCVSLFTWYTTVFSLSFSLKVCGLTVTSQENIPNYLYKLTNKCGHVKLYIFFANMCGSLCVPLGS